MKFRFCFSLLLISVFTNVFAQTDNRFVGSWQGAIDVGAKLRLVFHINIDSLGKLVSTLDSPDQSAYGIPTNGTRTAGDSVYIDMSGIGASFKGLLISDSVIQGSFIQGMEFPLELRRGVKASARKRPQHPEPPFPYQSIELEFEGKETGITYAGTLTVPQGKGPFPAAVLITGSGPQNRNEELMGHKPFLVLSDHLTRNGFAVLRIDDRGVGGSGGSFAGSTTEDFARDINEAFSFLAQRPEADRKRMGLIGHSEGGMIAPMVASRRKDVDFIVLLAAPGVPIPDLMTDQVSAVLKSSGVDSLSIASYRPLYRKIMWAIVESPDSASAVQAAKAAFTEWQYQTPDEREAGLGFTPSGDNTAYIQSMVDNSYTPWFRYFYRFDPAKWLVQSRAKVLAMNGSEDIQVLSKSNLEGIRAALVKGKTKTFKVMELEGLNHLFQSCTRCNIAEYGELEETFSPQALNIITEWLNKHVK